MFTPLNLPKARLKLTYKPHATNKGEQQVYVWDMFRKKNLILTPEEWVRQHFLHFLVNQKSVPLGLISTEQTITVNKLVRRCDAVIYSKEGKPVAIIECKAPHIELSEETFYQIAQYNFKFRVNWLILTNGLQTIIAFVDHELKKMVYIEEMPNFELLK